MGIDRHLPFLGLLILLPLAAGLLVLDVPGEPMWGIAFTAGALLYSGWLTARRLRDPDEVKSAAVSFGVVVGSGLGAAVAVMVVVSMIAVPGLADFITQQAVTDNGLSPANVGFAYGVLFTVVAMMLGFAIGHSGWWLSRR